MNAQPFNDPSPLDPEDDLRDRAVRRIRQKRDLATNAVAFVLINGFVVAIWYVTTPGSFFWPVFLLFGWGIGLVFHAWDVLRPTPTQKQISDEMARMSRR